MTMDTAPDSTADTPSPGYPHADAADASAAVSAVSNVRHTPRGTEDPLELLMERVRRAHEEAVADLISRLDQGQRVTAEQMYAALHAQILRTWWSLVARHGDKYGLSTAHVVTKVSFWIRCYLTDDPGDGPAAPAARVRGTTTDQELAQAHLDYAVAFIKRAAARKFLDLAKQLGPACSAETAGTEAAK